MSTLSRYPQEEALIDIVQGAGQTGTYVADCILPPTQVSDCKFKWIDWATTANNDGMFDNLKEFDDTVGCYGTPSSIDPSSYKYKFAELKDHGGRVDLKECCGPKECGTELFDFDAKKTEELVNRLLLGREKRVLATAFTDDFYTDETASNPDSVSAEGALFNLDLSVTGGTPAADAFKFMQDVQADNLETGMRNVLVTTRKVLNAILRHPTFKDGGCSIPLQADLNQIASILGVERICLVDAVENTAAAGSAYSLSKLVGDKIFLSKSIEFATSESVTRAFGFSAYMKGFRQRIHFNNDLGIDGGFQLTAGHDFTEVVAERKAATLINVTGL